MAVIVIIVTVLALEGLLSTFESREVLESTPNQYAFYRFDPRLGWANEPNSVGIYKRREFEYDCWDQFLRDAVPGLFQR